MKRLSFTEHPATVGENYFEHLRHASGFAGSMIAGGLACLVHAILPFLFTTTGSGVIATLNTRMITHRRQVVMPPSRPSPVEGEGSRLPSARWGRAGVGVRHGTP